MHTEFDPSAKSLDNAAHGLGDPAIVDDPGGPDKERTSPADMRLATLQFRNIYTLYIDVVLLCPLEQCVHALEFGSVRSDKQLAADFIRNVVLPAEGLRGLRSAAA